MFRNFKTVSRILYGRGGFAQLDQLTEEVRDDRLEGVAFVVDDVFKDIPVADRLPLRERDAVLWVNVDQEPSTETVDALATEIRARRMNPPAAVVGLGGGSVLDIAKAVSVMLTNPGSSADYQGWDLVRNPSVYHIGVPTLSGTGAEVSRTAVLIGPVRKLGINSDHSVFDQILLDPDLTITVPGEQWFYTGMDCYIHCVESLSGTYLNAFSRAYGEKSLELCREVFHGPRGPGSDEKLMIASLHGGMSIAYSQVGVCHALSYGLSYVLGLHHGIGNCVAFNCLEEFYPEGVAEFRDMCGKHGIVLPRGLVENLEESRLDRMTGIALSLDPLWENALGDNWRDRMPESRVRELYRRM
ncbi:MAG: iron-containing alcohol dehydrogenase [Deltaproteobacteria bacterium]|nr:iron-containing alcohol dehydrogenase [Deltaproteobacteria bacterium]